MSNYLYYTVFLIGLAYILHKLLFLTDDAKPIGKSALDTIFERVEKKAKSIVSKKKFK